MNQSAEKRIRKKKRVVKILVDDPGDDFPKDLLENMPDGIQFVGKAEPKKLARDYARIGQFIVNIAVCNKVGIKFMRKCFPREEYTKLKNRITARFYRKLKMSSSQMSKETYQEMITENTRL